MLAGGRVPLVPGEARLVVAEQHERVRRRTVTEHVTVVVNVVGWKQGRDLGDLEKLLLGQLDERRRHALPDDPRA